MLFVSGRACAQIGVWNLNVIRTNVGACAILGVRRLNASGGSEGTRRAGLVNQLIAIVAALARLALLTVTVVPESRLTCTDFLAIADRNGFKVQPLKASISFQVLTFTVSNIVNVLITVRVLCCAVRTNLTGAIDGSSRVISPLTHDAVLPSALVSALTHTTMPVSVRRILRACAICGIGRGDIWRGPTINALYAS